MNCSVERMSLVNHIIAKYQAITSWSTWLNFAKANFNYTKQKRLKFVITTVVGKIKSLFGSPGCRSCSDVVRLSSNETKTAHVFKATQSKTKIAFRVKSPIHNLFLKSLFLSKQKKGLHCVITEFALNPILQKNHIIFNTKILN